MTELTEFEKEIIERYGFVNPQESDMKYAVDWDYTYDSTKRTAWFDNKTDLMEFVRQLLTKKPGHIDITPVYGGLHRTYDYGETEY